MKSVELGERLADREQKNVVDESGITRDRARGVCKEKTDKKSKK